MDTVGVYQAKTHLAKLLDRVAKGDSITIARHGVPVAQLSPVEPDSLHDVEAAVEAIRAFGRVHATGGMSVRQMIEQGRP